LNTRGKEAAALALHRFGFGALRDSITAIAADPRGALLSDLDRPGAGFLAVKLPSSAAAARAVSDFRAEEQAKSKLAQRAKKEAEAMGMASASDAAASTPPLSTLMSMPKPSEPPLPQQIFQNEAAARYEAAAGADIGFVERLVWFWSNHFCISADKDIAMVGAYEREAIRAHVLGRFADMLIAVESHPAMLYYLDNVGSMGADSIAGISGDKGLNENLAREILELHTLGVRSGYSQADVTNFAKVLTGWTSTDAADPAHGGEFLFNKRLHEPGQQTVLGKFYAQGGADQGRAVLADLAHHTATARRTKTGPPLCRRRTAAAACRQAGEGFHGQRRKFEGRRQGVGDSRRSVDAGAHQTQAAVRMDHQHVAVDERVVEHGCALERRPRAGRAGDTRRIAVAAAGAERMVRYRSSVDRRCPAPARHCQRVCRTPALHRPRGAARGARPDRLAQYP
jgi:hypothetical protein